MEKFAHSKRARLFFLIYSIVGSIGMLMFFKYTNFFITNINALLGTSIATLSLTLPLGISFYTFQTMSYSIDVYRGDVPTEHMFYRCSCHIRLLRIRQNIRNRG